MFLSAVFPGFSLILDPTGRLGWKVGSVSACEESEDNVGGISGQCF